MTGFVYAIGDGNGAVKIGWSADPIRRLSKIACDCPAAPKLLGLIEATQAQEYEAHRLLEPWCIRREWFRLEGPVLAFVEMLPKPGPRGRKRTFSEGDHPLKGWRINSEVTLETVAKEVGVSRPQLCKIENRKGLPSLALACRLSKLTGIPAAEFGALQ